jgi:hypothetical protein
MHFPVVLYLTATLGHSDKHHKANRKVPFLISLANDVADCTESTTIWKCQGNSTYQRRTEQEADIRK